MKNVYPACEFDIESYIRGRGIVPRPQGNAGVRRYDPDYVDIISAFDIETTYLAEDRQSIMYIWQWAFDDICLIGRTWDEFKDLRGRVSQALEGKYLVVYVHNLSYEFQFISDPSIYEFEAAEVFAVRPRKVLKCTMKEYNIEFRCSYLHSNMSLDKFLERQGVEHRKLTYDYKKIRYPWTILTDDELAYCVNDVLGLVEAIRHEMSVDGDTLHTIPMTSTGYVRREAKRALRPYGRQIGEMLPEYEIFQMLREAFRGGNTHASRHIAGEIITGVHSYDRSSSYPDVICNCKFPMSKWWRTGYMETEKADELVNGGRYACVFRVCFGHISLRDDEEPCPYISYDKCRNVKNPLLDNGRILEADYLETTLTDIDYRITIRQYRADSVVIIDSAYCRYGYLPRGLRELTIDYYRRKTELKGVEGQEYFYNRSKELLNSLYGMMAQNPLHDRYIFDNTAEGLFNREHGNEEEYVRNLRRQWETYAWGVWVTAWSRLRLDDGIELVNKTPDAYFVYADTDSVKYIGNVDWTCYNEERKKDSIKSGAFADDPGGSRHYMGVYEHDGDYLRFRTWGAKKYAYEDTSGLHITVAGVVKRTGAEELKRLGGLEAFKPGLIFREAGGVDAIYNDRPEGAIRSPDGAMIPITRNVALVEGEYTLGIVNEYRDLIKYETFDGFFTDDILDRIRGGY